MFDKSGRQNKRSSSKEARPATSVDSSICRANFLYLIIETSVFSTFVAKSAIRRATVLFDKGIVDKCLADFLSNIQVAISIKHDFIRVSPIV